MCPTALESRAAPPPRGRPLRAPRIGLLLVLCPLLWGEPCEGFGEFPEDTPSVEGGFSVSHTPPPTCAPYRELLVSATTQCATPESLRVSLHFRTLGEGGFYDRPMEPIGVNLFQGSVPARIVADRGAEYYITARFGQGMASAGSPDAPFAVTTGYRYEGPIPEELPGDDFLQSLELPPEPGETGEEAQTSDAESRSDIQLVLVLIIVALVALLYQRLSTR